jgi:hypothetical protein
MDITKRTEAKLAADADRIIRLTLAEAAALPGFLKRIVPACLTHRGWYGCTLDGVKTLYLEAK